MQKVFLDANIFFAAIRNPEGGSGFILDSYTKKKPFKLITSTHVIAEATRNILQKLGEQKLNQFYDILSRAKPKAHPLLFTPKEIEYYLRFVPLKDVPILGGAHKLDVNYLVTLDKKHFLGKKDIFEKNFALEVLNPRDFLQQYD